MRHISELQRFQIYTYGRNCVHQNSSWWKYCIVQKKYLSVWFCMEGEITECTNMSTKKSLHIHTHINTYTYMYIYLQKRSVFHSWEESGERVHWRKGGETGDIKKKEEWPFSWLHTIDKLNQMQEILPWNCLWETVKGVSDFTTFTERMGIKWRVETQISHRNTDGREWGPESVESPHSWISWEIEEGVIILDFERL